MRNSSLAMLVAVLPLGCRADVKGVEHEGSTGSCYQEADDEGGPRTSCSYPRLPADPKVDILFVIDNSGSMGQEQGKLAAAMDSFIDALEVRGEPIDYRIAFTTTDNGNPWCGAVTTPEAGAFVLSSCRARLDQFTFSGTNPPTVMDSVACTDHCDYGAAELDDAMKPTTVDVDGEVKLRPWIQRVVGETNLPSGVTAAEAASCFAPQGIDGCGFESHLESMYKGLQRTKNQGEASFGFVRDNAVLAIVVLTDEVDCSYNPQWQEIFEVGQWPNPEAELPTSAVCWNAGVACSGGPTQYDSCDPVDLDVEGKVTNDEGAAVLRPVARYEDVLQGFENQKKMSHPDSEVLVAVIGGVPSGYATGAAEIPYADAADPQVQEDFGIGPGCTSADGDAVPPVRLRALADGFAERSLYSVCDSDYAPTLEAIAARIGAQMPPACFRDCADDVDADTPGLQVNCVLEQWAPGQPAEEIAQCERAGGAHALPADADVCWYALTDASQAGDPIDDLSDQCVDEGWNLEFKLIRRTGVPAPDGSTITTLCELSGSPDADCPNLGG